MSIEDKISEIQGKTENVRMAYISVFVTIIMTFIIILWIFSLRVDVRNIVNDVDNVTALPDGGSQLRNLRDAINDSGAAVGDIVDQIEVIDDALDSDGEK